MSKQGVKQKTSCNNQSFIIQVTIDQSNHLTNYGKSNPSILEENHWKM